MGRRGGARADETDAGQADAGERPGPDLPETTGRSEIAGHRVLRRIAAGERAEVYLGRRPGSDDGGLVALRVYRPETDARSIALELSAAEALPPGTVPEVHDVCTLEDGRVCVIAEMLTGGVLARLIDTRTVTPGEAVTLLAPIVVAVDRLHAAGFAHGRLAPGDVLLSDEGRPVLAGLGTLTLLADLPAAERHRLVRADYAALALLLRAVADRTSPAPAGRPDVWAQERLGVRPFEPCAGALEREVFAMGTASPVRLDTGVPAGPSGSFAPVRGPRREEPMLEEAGDERGEDDGGHVGLLARLLHLPADAAVVLLDAVERGPASLVRRRLADRMRGRRSVVLVAVCTAVSALVLALTLLPPGEDAPMAAEPAATAGSGAAEDPAGVQPSGGGPPAFADQDDPVEAVAVLLAERERCFAELSASCLERIAQPGSGVAAADRAWLGAALQGGAEERLPLWPARLEMIGEMGDAVLVELRSAPESRTASALVVRGEAGWRLREIFSE